MLKRLLSLLFIFNAKSINLIQPRITQSYPNGYNYISHKSLLFGWNIVDNKLSITSQIKVDSCNSWISIAFTKNYNKMIYAESIFGW